MKTQMIFRRYELKYLMTRRQRDQLLSAAERYLVPDEFSHSSIRNLYLDTPDFRLIRRSLEGPVYKEKLRVRSYGRAGRTAPVFVELKKKYRSVVYKRRLSLPQDQAMRSLYGESKWPDTQIGKEIAYAIDFYRTLSPAVFLSYERDSFRARDGGDFRVTFDDRILFRRKALTLDSEPWGQSILGPEQVLMELKVSGGIPLWMTGLLSELGLFKTSFSKYGTAYQMMLRESMEGGRRYA